MLLRISFCIVILCSFVSLYPMWGALSNFFKPVDSAPSSPGNATHNQSDPGPRMPTSKTTHIALDDLDELGGIEVNDGWVVVDYENCLRNLVPDDYGRSVMSFLAHFVCTIYLPNFFKQDCKECEWDGIYVQAYGLVQCMAEKFIASQDKFYQESSGFSLFDDDKKERFYAVTPIFFNLLYNIFYSYKCGAQYLRWLSCASDFFYDQLVAANPHLAAASGKSFDEDLTLKEDTINAVMTRIQSICTPSPLE